MAFNEKILAHYPGSVVRKDLTKHLKGNAVVPTYVLEYLLGQHCSTDDEKIIEFGIEKVQQIIAQHFVHREEAEIIKSNIRERGSYRIIDKMMVTLNDRLDRYEASFSNLGLRRVPINTNIVKNNKKLLSEGVWSLIDVSYEVVDDRNTLPWVIDAVKPIQISNIDIEDYKKQRQNFTLEEWMNLLMQSIGLNPEEFTERSKLIQLARLIPFTENNFNLIELGPKGTGKSHIYSEMSPHGILLSGGEVTRAKLFVNNATGNIGLVGYWDVVAYDEFAGKNKRVDQGLVDIMKNYMANKSFSRGADVHQAEASFAFVGNTDRSVSNMVRNTHLFVALPEKYQDSAFLDRVHLYIPGWEVAKLRNELFTDEFGFVVDYIAEVLKHMRKIDFGNSFEKYFQLSNTITTRDKTSIEKTFSGLVKILFPHGEFTEEEAKMMLEFAIEGRKRVKLQLQKMDETFREDIVNFEYTDNKGKVHTVQTLEELEYGRASFAQQIKEESGQQLETVEDNISTTSIPTQTSQPIKPLREFNKRIRDNQSNISYNSLFGDYLVGATSLTIEDPYIRHPYQFRNLMELISLMLNKNPDAEDLKIHLITYNEEDYLQQSAEYLEDIKLSLEEENVEFTYEFDDKAHDRSLYLDNGWRIVLGRGLDIWQKSLGRFGIAEYDQSKRKCRQFDIVVFRG